MKKHVPDYSLYFIVDIPSVQRSRHDAPSLVDTVLQNGGTIIQVRGKDISTRELYEESMRIGEVTRAHNAPLIINDRIDVALASRADGIHLGKSDMPLPQARELLPHGIIGYSIDDEHDIRHAEANSADYVSAGPVFATSTKQDTGPLLGTEGVARLVSHAHVPCVAIGGISPENVQAVAASGVDGVCVISALLNAPDIAAACREMTRSISGKVVSKVS